MKLLILDLDETLIYAIKNPLPRPHDFNAGPYVVYKRPYVDAFINFCPQHFKVAIWTSSTRSYATAVIRSLFPQNYPLEFVLTREHCVKRFEPELQQFYYIKDLRKVEKKGYALEHVIMLDDSPQKLSRHYGNLVRITEWLGDEGDDELKRVQPYLLELNKQPNVRRVEKRNWRSQVKHEADKYSC